MAFQNISTCSMIVEVNISAWTARKLDKSTTEEVVSDKHAGSKDAARVNKSLLAGRTELKDIESLAGEVRTYVYNNTMPWSNSGQRLLPTLKYMEFDARIKQYEQTFYDKVKDFIALYPSLISAQAFALGNMFKRDDFPLPETLQSKFAFTVGYLPVPDAGDWRIDQEIENQQALREQLTKLSEQRVKDALNDVWQRLGTHLKRMATQLGTKVVNGEEKKGKVYDSLLDTGWELVDLCKAMNLTNDPVLEEARLGLEHALKGVTIDELRKNDAVKRDVHDEVKALLSKFDF